MNKKVFLSIPLLLMTQSAFALSIEERVERLEQKAESGVYFKLVRQLDDQERSLQQLEDSIERLSFEHSKTKKNLEARIQQLEEQLQQLSAESSNKLLEQSSESTSTASQEGALEEVENESKSQVGVENVSTSTQPEQVNRDSVLVFSIRQVEPSTKEVSDLYQKGFGLLGQSQHSEAIKVFEKLVVRYPNSELASNAYYWMGEAYVVLGQPNEAYVAFKSCVEYFSELPKAPDALYRAYKVQQKLNNDSIAEALKAVLIERYPDARVTQLVK
jgi:tol-pal system protein YbgF